MSDIRQALRLLRKSPLFTVTIVLIVALGIGASTTIFSVVNAILLRPLPFADPQRLMQVAEKNDALRLNAFGVSALNYRSWTELTRSFEALGAVQFGTYTLTGRGDPETYTGNAISVSLVPLLGLHPVVGNAFAPGEDRSGGPALVMISEALWRRRFGGDRGIVGRTVTVNGTASTVVGVAPTALTTLTNGDLWVPLVIDPAKEIRLNHVLFVVGRLKPGITPAAAQADMDGVARRMREQYPELKDWGVNLIAFTDAFVSRQLRTALLVLLGAAVFVLVIVSANVANLLLSRAIERQREMAIRLALGAGALRLWRQLLIESLVLSTVGGVAGLAAAVWGARVLESVLPPNVLPVPDIGVDPTVVAFALAVTVATGVVFGLAPAWQSTKVELNATLYAAGRSSVGGFRPVLRKGLAAAELALATVLLVGAALLVRSLLELQRVPLGFDAQGVVAFQVALPPTTYDNTKRVAFHRDLAAALRAIPGVQAAAVSSGIPFGVGNYTTSPYEAPGSAVLPAGSSVPIDWRTVSPGLFAALRVPLLRGRDFTDGDTEAAPA
jgi:putative ABC transport system permease protein